MPRHQSHRGTRGVFMKANLLIGIICLLTAVSLSGVAGVYAATNMPARIGRGVYGMRRASRRREMGRRHELFRASATEPTKKKADTLRCPLFLYAQLDTQRLDAQCLPKRSSGPVSWHLEKLLRNGEFSVGESENIHRKNPEPDSVVMVRMIRDGGCLEGPW